MPCSDCPLVSIIIPVYNKIEYTWNCLKSLAKNLSRDIPVEIIVVDDASIDQTAKILEKVEGLILIRNLNNMGFLRSCNQAISKANGEYICLLNNDTEIYPNWLESLVEVLKSNDRVGAVGSKLVYPSGILQEAGGIIWSDATGCNYGRNSNPNAPEYNYLRPVDYCSGASLLVRNSIFKANNGFDRLFAPAYYEDTDLCFFIRHNLGLNVVYQPKSQVIHYEGATSGTDMTCGVKSYQTINATKFAKKWQKVLEDCFENNPFNLSPASRRLIGEQTILVIDSYVPQYDKESGSKRLFQLIEIFKRLNFHIIFAPDNCFPEQPYTSDLQELGVEVLYICESYCTPLEKQIESRLELLNFAWICRPELNKKYTPLLRQNPSIKIIYDTVDLHYVRLRRAWELMPEDIHKATAKRLWQQMQVLELEMAEQADLVVTVSQDEQELLIQQSTSPIAVIPNIHKFYPGAKPPFDLRTDILFIGSYNHPPNVDAVTWLCKSIMPLVWEALPEVKVTLLGSNPPQEVQRLASGRVSIIGYVRDINPYFLNHRVFVAPLRYGAGMKGKVGQSLEYGLPIVSTSIGIEGMGLTHEQNALVADTVSDFAKQILRLYKNRDLWEHLAQNSESTIACFSMESTQKSLESLFRQLDNKIVLVGENNFEIGLECTIARDNKDRSVQTNIRSRPKSFPKLLSESLILNFFSDTQLKSNGLVLDFPYYEVESLGEYKDYEQKMERTFQKRRQLEKLLSLSGKPFKFKGYHFLLNKYVDYEVDFNYSYLDFEGVRLPNFRETCVCSESKLNNRLRGLLRLINYKGLWNLLTKGNVYMTECITPFYQYLIDLNPYMVGSEFLGEAIPLGSQKDGVRNEDITNLSFSDSMFDVLISNDILEHVPSYNKAYAEVYRVLKPGGYLFLTVPFDSNRQEHLIRATVNQDGSINHIEPPEYHGNPLNLDEGILCFQIFGWQLLDELKEAGFQSAKTVFYWSYLHGFLGDNLAIVYAKK
ncbi:glycosyltransferase [Pseudanabaena sp. PCC 6802]|uniref:glycosyltransferase n=1 Tax=Pseudanabaena sp. PCC 6802 TaxID=118173 RepID=UPI00034C7089|nr:glycosyltransferase [Pseudanabaena sp. PCC 6802]